MIKLETHCHLLGSSYCAHASAQTIINEYKDAGYKGIVLTNHIHPVCYNQYPGQTHKQKIDYWFSLVDAFVKLGVDNGLKIFYGMEVCAYRTDNKYSEYTLYGFERSFLYDNKPLFNFTQEELFRLADNNKIFMYQTHPFRERVTVGSPEFLHGAESFNGHVGHKNNNAKANEFCEKYSLKKLAGTDYHDEGQALTGGIYIPDNINDNRALTDYLFNNQPALYANEELYQKEYRGTP